MRVHVDHKETMQAWADRLKLSLTQLYMVLTCQAGEQELNRLVLTEFSLKQMQRLGLPLNAAMIVHHNNEAMKQLIFLMSAGAKLEFAEAVGDYVTAQSMRTRLDQIEGDLLRAFGLAKKEFEANQN